MEKSSRLKGRIAVICGALGHLNKGDYFIEPSCEEGVKDLIRLLKKDDNSHAARRCMGEINIVQNHLVHIIKKCGQDEQLLFSITLRLLINVTTPAMLLFGEEVPQDKTERHIYLTLVGHDQNYKQAFCDVEFWNKVCCRLTNLFEIDWSERSSDDGIEIERILTLLRNVLQIPADTEDLKKPDNDETIHDKVLFALRQSQILELILLVSSNFNEEAYYLNILEIFSLLLREQNPKVLARCIAENADVVEENQDVEELVRAREKEKINQRNYSNIRNFKSTFVIKGVKSLSNKDIVCHKSLDNLRNLSINDENKKVLRRSKNRIPAESQRMERRSTYSVRLFLKEFCLEFMSNFNNFMGIVKNRLDSGKSLAHDQTYYFWAVAFFLQFAIEANLDFELIKNCFSIELFHLIQISLDTGFEHLKVKNAKDNANWVRRIHTILKAYHGLLETLLWVDKSKGPLIRAISREIKSDLFYIVEYRELILHLLFKFDSTKFSVSYLRDLIQATHLFLKLVEEFSEQTKLVVQKIVRKRKTKKKGKESKKEEKLNEGKTEKSKEEIWESIKDDIYDILVARSSFPEIPPFDAASDIPIDDQKETAMKRIQCFLHKHNIVDAIGLLRSSRQVWPENDYFGSDGMMAEDETMALQEICLADLGPVFVKDDKTDNIGTERRDEKNVVSEEEENEGGEREEDDEEKERSRIVEEDFNLLEFKRRLVDKKVVECCGILLKNYKNNSNHVNHCTVKLLHRIGWECGVPAVLYQASLFWTLLRIMDDKSQNYSEVNKFTVNLFRQFRKHAEKNPVVFLELLFYKSYNVALQIQYGYESYGDTKKPKTSRKKSGKISCEEDEKENETVQKRKKKKEKSRTDEKNNEQNESSVKLKKGNRKRGRKGRTILDESEISSNAGIRLREDGDDDNSRGLPMDDGSGSDLERKSMSDIEAETYFDSIESQNKVRASKFLFQSSDEEEIAENKMRDARKVEQSEEDEECNKIANIDDETYLIQPQKEALGNSNQVTDASPEKRNGKTSELVSDEQNSDESFMSLSKRPRFIDSDSELDEDYSCSKNVVAKKRRPATIDSDSDVGDIEEDVVNK